MNLLQRIDTWFTAPEPNAAQNMGVFRIVYTLFYLWQLSLLDLRKIAGFPEHNVYELVIFHVLPFDLGVRFFMTLDVMLVASLVLLGFGWRVKAMTWAVLALGVVREAYPAAIHVESANVFLVFYIPLFMGLFGRWGERYSIEPARPDARGDDHWTHFLGARACLVVLAALFVSSPLYKSFLGGTWLSEPHLLTNLALLRSLQAESLGLISNPLAPWLAANPGAGYAAQLFVLVFEGSFFLVLFGPRLRALYLAAALFFHALNALFLVVTFTGVLVVYALFVDWETLRQPIARKLRGRTRPRPNAAVAFGSAFVIAGTWYTGMRDAWNVWGFLNWQNPFFVIGPLAAAVIALQVVRIMRRA